MPGENDARSAFLELRMIDAHGAKRRPGIASTGQLDPHLDGDLAA